ncbi:autotransporter outer membrane beta-barrel domain-containing protein [Vibrio sp. SS-MA-C1-2]|uniref:autotransporter outer membrane beta-barrel domain-containing protein n=1 Tax=Vibrio sp. SS-MA-C1-2 TaxID=2908646 RepID=UPI001F1AC85F|nr:autotransporter outer membrane beta-barrel domain-containing protein [Vibrio sp. SS-MA-C1-2]UJF18443.1 autotransporter outer membrane beta-barrel domain-containing protein [Vibrio sp. SS-MA-C1-2]
MLLKKSLLAISITTLLSTSAFATSLSSNNENDETPNFEPILEIIKNRPMTVKDEEKEISKHRTIDVNNDNGVGVQAVSSTNSTLLTSADGTQYILTAPKFSTAQAKSFKLLINQFIDNESLSEKLKSIIDNNAGELELHSTTTDGSTPTEIHIDKNGIITKTVVTQNERLPMSPETTTVELGTISQDGVITDTNGDVVSIDSISNVTNYGTINANGDDSIAMLSTDTAMNQTNGYISTPTKVINDGEINANGTGSIGMQAGVQSRDYASIIANNHGDNIKELISTLEEISSDDHITMIEKQNYLSQLRELVNSIQNSPMTITHGTVENSGVINASGRQSVAININNGTATNTTDGVINVTGSHATAVNYNSQADGEFINDGAINIGVTGNLVTIDNEAVEVNSNENSEIDTDQFIYGSQEGVSYTSNGVTHSFTNNGIIRKEVGANDYGVASVTNVSAGNYLGYSVQQDAVIVNDGQGNITVMSEEDAVMAAENQSLAGTQSASINTARTELQTNAYMLDMINSNISERNSAIVEGDKTSAWVRLNYRKGGQSGDTQHTDFYTSGVTVGADMNMGLSGKVGAAFTYAYNSTDYNNSITTDSSSDNYAFTVYLQQDLVKSFFVEANATYAYTNYDIDSAGSTDGNSFNVRTAVGYNVDMNNAGNMIVKGIYNYSLSTMDNFATYGVYEHEMNDYSKSEVGAELRYKKDFLLSNQAVISPVLNATYMYNLANNNNYYTSVAGNQISAEDNDSTVISDLGVAYKTGQLTSQLSWKHLNNGDYNDDSAYLSLNYVY